MDTFKLQRDLNVIYKWTSNNNMKLNGNKFEHISYGKNDENKLLSVYFDNNSKVIEKKSIVKDLGVLMQQDCKFDHHIARTIEKAKNISGWILRTFESRESHLMLTLWKSLVIPHVDYCSQLWLPIRKIYRASNNNYWDLLKRFKLYSLKRRRERYAIIYVWKIIENIVPNFSHNENGIELGGISWYHHNRLGRKCMIPTIERGPFQSIRSASLAFQGPRLFNCLPQNLRNLSGCTVNNFKSKLDKFLSEVPDEPLVPNYVKYRRAQSNSLIDMLSVGLSKLDTR